MNILHLITSLKVGGAESALVNYLSKVVGHDRNMHSVAYFHHGPNVVKIQNLGIKTYQISGVFSIYDPVFFFRLIKLIKFIKPDVIHSSLWSANIAARLISKISKIPVICDLHGNSFDEGKLRNWFDRKTVNYCAKIVAVSDSVKDSYFKNIIGAKCSNLTVIKNGIDVDDLRNKAFTEPLTRKDFGITDDDFVVGAVGRLEPIKSYDVLIRAFARVLALNFLQNQARRPSDFALRASTDRLGDGSTSSRRRLFGYGAQAPRARLPNPLILSDLRCEAEQIVSKDRPAVPGVATTCSSELPERSGKGEAWELVEGRERGQNRFKVNAAANAKLIIVGDGSQMQNLKDLVKSLDIESHVIFTGFRSDAYKFYPIFDCFALSSQSEGLSIALLEAMAFGLPVISTNSDVNNHDVITPGINGFLVYPNDIDGYSTAINTLFQDHQYGQRLRQIIGECNLACVRTDFCIDGVVSRYKQLYRDVVR